MWAMLRRSIFHKKISSSTSQTMQYDIPYSHMRITIDYKMHISVPLCRCRVLTHQYNNDDSDGSTAQAI